MEERKLYRSRDDRMIGGVAAGIADFFDLDPSLVRLLAVLLAVVGNMAAVVAYIVMWIVVPEQPLTTAASHEPARELVGAAVATAAVGARTPTAQAATSSPPPGGPPAPPAPPQSPPPGPRPSYQGARTGVIWLGLLLIMVGTALLAEEVVPNLDLWGFWPATLAGLVMIAVGIRQMVTPGGDD